MSFPASNVSSFFARFRSTVAGLSFSFLLLPSGGLLNAAEDPALVPANVIANPGERHAPSTRQFQGIPGMAVTHEGRLWAVWYGGGSGPGPGNYVMLANSDDGGRTWSSVNHVIEADVRVFDPAIWTDPDGRIWVFYSQGHKLWDGRAGVWTIVSENPDVEQPEWSEPRRLTDGIMLNKPTALSSGEWLLPIARWNQEPNEGLSPDAETYVPEEFVHWDPEDVGSHVYVSRDRGDSFSRLSSVRLPGVLFDEHMITEGRDGVLRFFVRNEEEGIVTKVSHDSGASWEPAPEEPIPHVPARFFVRTLRSGNLLLVKHNPELDGVWLHGAGVHEPRTFRARLVAYLSEDDGRSWRGGLVLDERVGVSYPDGDQAADGTIYIAYDYDRMNAKQILMAAFTEEDVLAGRIVSSEGRLKQLINQAAGADNL